jgi:mycothiol synthase
MLSIFRSINSNIGLVFRKPAKIHGGAKFMYSSFPVLRESDCLEMRAMLKQSGNELATGDFDELIALPTIRAGTRLWRNQAGHLIAFAFVDDFNNLCFALDEEIAPAAVEADLVGWGVAYLQRRNSDQDEQATLDASCSADNPTRLAFLEKYGFKRDEVRSLYYERSLRIPILETVLPDGFSLRTVTGEEQAGLLAALHRAAFGTEHMTLEYRLAMMRVPDYDPSLDLYIEAPGGKPVAFCVCSIASEENQKGGRLTGYTDPIGVDSGYQGRGLGKAVLIAGLQALKSRGMEWAKLGTSSQNTAMQRLAESVGFQVVSQKLWFSKIV